MSELTTDRLLLRRWRSSDLEPFARMNADPRVMEHFPAPLDRAQSDAMVERIEQGFDRHGFGLWVVELPGEAPFVGFVGLSVPRFQAPFMPAVEIGWRLDAGWWGRGIASEAARAAAGYGFGAAGLDELVSFTAPVNGRSRAVMERIGMTHDPAGDFDHPMLPPGHRLRRHLLYRLRQPNFQEPPAT